MHNAPNRGTILPLYKYYTDYKQVLSLKYLQQQVAFFAWHDGCGTLENGLNHFLKFRTHSCQAKKATYI